MISAPQIFSVYPSVIPADETATMTVTANERAHFFPDGEEYQIRVVGVNSDENYYTRTKQKTYDVTAKGGVLVFEHFFEGEQEHAVLLMKEGKVVQMLSVYSLSEDLYRLRPLKGDLHSHSVRSDGSLDAAALFSYFRRYGYEFAALTDHNRYYPGGEIDEAFAGVTTGITRVLGEEVHCPGSIVHIVHVGGKKSVASRYVKEREKYEAELSEYTKKVPADIPEEYKSRYAKAMWATDAIHEAGGLAVFAHPYWRPNASKTHNVCDELAKILLMSGMFDAYELIGSMGQIGNNRSVALWSELRAEGLKIPVVGSSDTHALDGGTFNHCFTVCFAEENTGDAVTAAVKQGLSVAVEATGEGSHREYRCYGSLRLVSYAQFLLSHYFPKLQRIGEGLGVSMRAFLAEDADASLIEAEAALLERFSARFFGKKAPLIPSEAMLTFENKWRETQLSQGPLTRGSNVDGAPAKSLV